MAKIKSKMILRKGPESYPLTEHQLQFKEIAEKCGIKKGMPHPELVEAMRTCVPAGWKKLREEQNAPPSGQPINAITHEPD